MKIGYYHIVYQKEDGSIFIGHASWGIEKNAIDIMMLWLGDKVKVVNQRRISYGKIGEIIVCRIDDVDVRFDDGSVRSYYLDELEKC